MTLPTEHLLRRAHRLHRQGRRAEAIDAYVELLRARPSLSDCWYDLGVLLKSEGRYEDALAAYQQALKHGVRSPEEVHLNRAVIYADHLRRDDDAERELTSALQRAPSYAPALLNLGNLHEERGRREPAIDCYRRIVDAAGDAVADLRLEALARLAQLQSPSGADDPLLQRLREAGRRTDVAAPVRANLLFALGRALDALGCHDEAFASFDAANRCIRDRGPRYDRARVERLVDALIAQSVATRAAETTSGGPAPLFICGMFRSGSTLLEQVLAAHPRCTAGGELELLPRLVASRLTPFPAALSTLADDAARALADDYRAQLSRLFPSAADAAYISDKRPDNFLLIGVIKRLFPSALILHTCRDPLDTGLSVFMQHLDPRVAPYASDLADIGHYFGQYRRLMTHWRRQYEDTLIDVDYDALVRDPRGVLQPLLARLGLDWDEACLDFHRRGGTVKTASYWQVRRPLYGEASGRWKRYRAPLQPLRDALAAAGVDTDAVAACTEA